MKFSNLFHNHSWKEYKEIEEYSSGYAYSDSYRHCTDCGRWQWCNDLLDNPSWVDIGSRRIPDPDWLVPSSLVDDELITLNNKRFAFVFCPKCGSRIVQATTTTKADPNTGKPLRYCIWRSCENYSCHYSMHREQDIEA